MTILLGVLLFLSVMLNVASLYCTARQEQLLFKAWQREGDLMLMVDQLQQAKEFFDD